MKVDLRSFHLLMAEPNPEQPETAPSPSPISLGPCSWSTQKYLLLTG
jgi:hypothetical protein